jgi:adenylate kinase family enzyme
MKNNRNMKKIAIIGPKGSGKTTLAHHLCSIVNVEIIHADAILGQSGESGTTESQGRKRLESYLQQPAWIIEGDGDPTNPDFIYERRFAAADTIIWLDLPQNVCVWRLLKRVFQPEGIFRKFAVSHYPRNIQKYGFLQGLVRTWNYMKQERSLVREKIDECCGDKRVFILRSPSEVKDFLDVIQRVNELSVSPSQCKAYKMTRGVTQLVAAPAVS